MQKVEVLNNVQHKDLGVKVEYSEVGGDNIASTVTFITEFSEVQKEYPILFRKDENDLYQAVVLFGLQKDENLFLQEFEEQGKPSGWKANYIPSAIARGPFMIGMQEDGESRVHVDMAHPKISFDEGVKVFRANGGNSPFLDAIVARLNLMKDGMRLNKSMFDMFEKYELIEPLSVEIQLQNQDKYSLTGFFTIDSEKLQSLDGEALVTLSRNGFLQAAYFVVASISNLQQLINIKNRQV